MSYYFGRRRWTSWYGDPAARDRRNQMRFALRSLAWMANFIVASMSLRNEWVPFDSGRPDPPTAIRRLGSPPTDANQES